LSQRAVQTRRRIPALRSCAEARFSSAPGRTACGRIEPKAAPDSSPETGRSIARRGQAWACEATDRQWPAPGVHERLLRSRRTLKTSVQASVGFGEVRLAHLGRHCRFGDQGSGRWMLPVFEARSVIDTGWSKGRSVPKPSRSVSRYEVRNGVEIWRLPISKCLSLKGSPVPMP
jgi:hypothetical protein